MFPRCSKVNGQAGFSLVQVLVGVGIGAIVMSAAANFFRSYSEQKWTQESKANARLHKEIVTNFVRAKVPISIAALSVTPPASNPAVWSCAAGGPCRFQTSTTDGIRLQVSCDSVASIPILNKTPFDKASIALSSGCVKCEPGKRPVLTMEIFSGGVLTKSQKFPDPNAENKLRDLVGMGMCFHAPLYQENIGTAAAPIMRNRWDRWKVTIIPYFFSSYPQAKDTSDQLLSKLKMAPEQLMLAPDAQLGPSMRIIR